MNKTARIVHDVHALSEPLFEAYLFDDSDECKRILELIHELTADIRSDLPNKSVQWKDGKPCILEL